MSILCFVALVIITTYQVEGFAINKTCEIMNIFSKRFSSTPCYSHLKYRTVTCTPTNLVTIVLVLATISLSLKLTFKEKKMPIYGKNGNLGVVSGRVLLPWRIPFIDQIYSIIQLRIGGVKVMDEWAKKFGTLYEVQFGPINLTVTSNPDVIQKVLSSSQREYLNRPEIYKRIFNDGFRDGLMTSEFGPWSAQRKRLTRSFTYKSLQQYLKYMNTHAKNLTKSFISTGNNKPCVDGKLLQAQIYRHTFRIIAQIVGDVDRFGEEESAKLSDNFCRFKDLMVDRLMNPLSPGHYLWFHSKKKEYDKLLNLIEESKTKILLDTKREMEIAMNTTEKERSNLSELDINIKPFRCMVRELLSSGASEKEICDQIGTIGGTGHETSVVAMQMLLMNLATNPEAQLKCREEVDTLFDNKILYTGGNSFDCELSMEDILNLKYLDMCILESGRLHSTVPIFLRRLDAPVKITEKILLGTGTNLGISLWTLHRDPKHFPNPETFDPDRFLCENVKKRHPYSYIPFSAGPRNCIGSKVAHLQIKVFMTWIIRHFEILSTDQIEDVKLLIGLTIVPERPFNIVLKRRATN